MDDPGMKHEHQHARANERLLLLPLKKVLFLLLSAMMQ